MAADRNPPISPSTDQRHSHIAKFSHSSSALGSLLLRVFDRAAKRLRFRFHRLSAFQDRFNGVAQIMFLHLLWVLLVVHLPHVDDLSFFVQQEELRGYIGAQHPPNLLALVAQIGIWIAFGLGAF